MSAVMVSMAVLNRTFAVNCAPSGEMHNYCTPHIIKENCENFLIRRCNYIFLSQVYCVWQVVKIPTIIFNNPVYQNNKFSYSEINYFKFYRLDNTQIIYLIVIL
jgi:hypothetical protein